MLPVKDRRREPIDVLACNKIIRKGPGTEGDGACCCRGGLIACAWFHKGAAPRERDPLPNKRACHCL